MLDPLTSTVEICILIAFFGGGATVLHPKLRRISLINKLAWNNRFWTEVDSQFFEKSIKDSVEFEDTANAWAELFESLAIVGRKGCATANAAERIRIAVRRVNDGVPLPPLGPPMLRGDQNPRRVYAPMHERDEREMYNALCNPKFVGSPLAEELQANVFELKDALPMEIKRAEIMYQRAVAEHSRTLAEVHAEEKTMTKWVKNQKKNNIQKEVEKAKANLDYQNDQLRIYRKLHEFSEGMAALRSRNYINQGGHMIPADNGTAAMLPPPLGAYARGRMPSKLTEPCFPRNEKGEQTVKKVPTPAGGDGGNIRRMPVTELGARLPVSYSAREVVVQQSGESLEVPERSRTPSQSHAPGSPVARPVPNGAGPSPPMVGTAARAAPRYPPAELARERAIRNGPLDDYLSAAQYSLDRPGAEDASSGRPTVGNPDDPRRPVAALPRPVEGIGLPPLEAYVQTRKDGRYDPEYQGRERKNQKMEKYLHEVIIKSPGSNPASTVGTIIRDPAHSGPSDVELPPRPNERADRPAPRHKPDPPVYAPLSDASDNQAYPPLTGFEKSANVIYQTTLRNLKSGEWVASEEGSLIAPASENDSEPQYMKGFEPPKGVSDPYQALSVNEAYPGYKPPKQAQSRSAAPPPLSSADSSQTAGSASRSALRPAVVPAFASAAGSSQGTQEPADPPPPSSARSRGGERSATPSSSLSLRMAQNGIKGSGGSSHRSASSSQSDIHLQPSTPETPQRLSTFGIKRTPSQLMDFDKAMEGYSSEGSQSGRSTVTSRAEGSVPPQGGRGPDPLSSASSTNKSPTGSDGYATARLIPPGTARSDESHSSSGQSTKSSQAGIRKQGSRGSSERVPVASPGAASPMVGQKTVPRGPTSPAGARAASPKGSQADGPTLAESTRGPGIPRSKLNQVELPPGNEANIGDYTPSGRSTGRGGGQDTHTVEASTPADFPERPQMSSAPKPTTGVEAAASLSRRSIPLVLPTQQYPGPPMMSSLYSPPRPPPPMAGFGMRQYWEASPSPSSGRQPVVTPFSVAKSSLQPGPGGEQDAPKIMREEKKEPVRAGPALAVSRSLSKELQSEQQGDRSGPASLPTPPQGQPRSQEPSPASSAVSSGARSQTGLQVPTSVSGSPASPAKSQSQQPPQIPWHAPQPAQPKTSTITQAKASTRVRAPESPAVPSHAQPPAQQHTSNQASKPTAVEPRRTSSGASFADPLSPSAVQLQKVIPPGPAGSSRRVPQRRTPKQDAKKIHVAQCAVLDKLASSPSSDDDPLGTTLFGSVPASSYDSHQSLSSGSSSPGSPARGKVASDDLRRRMAPGTVGRAVESWTRSMHETQKATVPPAKESPAPRRANPTWKGDVAVSPSPQGGKSGPFSTDSAKLVGRPRGLGKIAVPDPGHLTSSSSGSQTSGQSRASGGGASSGRTSQRAIPAVHDAQERMREAGGEDAQPAVRAAGSWAKSLEFLREDQSLAHQTKTAQRLSQKTALLRGMTDSSSGSPKAAQQKRSGSGASKPTSEAATQALLAGQARSDSESARSGRGSAASSSRGASERGARSGPGLAGRSLTGSSQGSARGKDGEKVQGSTQGSPFIRPKANIKGSLSSSDDARTSSIMSISSSARESSRSSGSTSGTASGTASGSSSDSPPRELVLGNTKVGSSDSDSDRCIQYVPPTGPSAWPSVSSTTDSPAKSTAHSSTRQGSRAEASSETHSSQMSPRQRRDHDERERELRVPVNDQQERVFQEMMARARASILESSEDSDAFVVPSSRAGTDPDRRAMTPQARLDEADHIIANTGRAEGTYERVRRETMERARQDGSRAPDVGAVSNTTAARNPTAASGTGGTGREVAVARQQGSRLTNPTPSSSSSSRHPSRSNTVSTTTTTNSTSTGNSSSSSKKKDLLSATAYIYLSHASALLEGAVSPPLDPIGEDDHAPSRRGRRRSAGSADGGGGTTGKRRSRGLDDAELERLWVRINEEDEDEEDGGKKEKGAKGRGGRGRGRDGNSGGKGKDDKDKGPGDAKGTRGLGRGRRGTG